MNRSNLILILSALIIAVIANSIYIVNEKEKALVTQFGEVIKPDVQVGIHFKIPLIQSCLLYTSPSPRDVEESRMPSSA